MPSSGIFSPPDFSSHRNKLVYFASQSRGKQSFDYVSGMGTIVECLTLRRLAGGRRRQEKCHPQFNFISNPTSDYSYPACSSTRRHNLMRKGLQVTIISSNARSLLSMVETPTLCAFNFASNENRNRGG